MNRMTQALVAIAALGAAGIASAHVAVSIGFGFPVAAPVYVAPQPVYYVQPPVVYAPPPPVYYQRSYAYYGEPVVVYRPAPAVVYGGYYGHRFHGRWHPGHRRMDRD